MKELHLPREYILLEHKGDYVLAFCPSYHLGRYATWQVGDDGYMNIGHYFPGPKQAAIDFETRCSEKTGAPVAGYLATKNA